MLDSHLSWKIHNISITLPNRYHMYSIIEFKVCQDLNISSWARNLSLFFIRQLRMLSKKVEEHVLVRFFFYSFKHAPFFVQIFIHVPYGTSLFFFQIFSKRFSSTHVRKYVTTSVRQFYQIFFEYDDVPISKKYLFGYIKSYLIVQAYLFWRVHTIEKN